MLVEFKKKPSNIKTGQNTDKYSLSPGCDSHFDELWSNLMWMMHINIWSIHLLWLFLALLDDLPFYLCTGKHPVSALIELCNKRRIMQPDFVMVHHSGPDHRKNFLFKVGTLAGYKLDLQGLSSLLKASASLHLNSVVSYLKKFSKLDLVFFIWQQDKQEASKSTAMVAAQGACRRPSDALS